MDSPLQWVAIDVHLDGGMKQVGLKKNEFEKQEMQRLIAVSCIFVHPGFNCAQKK